MRVDLVLGGADAIKQAFRDISAELDKVNKKMGTFASSAGSVKAGSSFANLASGSSDIVSSATSGVNPSITPPSVAPKANSAVSVAQGILGARSLGSAAGAAASFIGKLNPVLGVAATAVTAFAAAVFESAKNIREYADFAFNARGGPGAAGQLAGVSNAAGVGLGEAAGISKNLAGGARRLNQMIDQLRDMKSDEDAARFAQANGIEGYRSVRNMTDSQYEKSKNMQTFGPDDQKKVDVVTTDMNLAFRDLTITVEKDLLPVFTILGEGASALAIIFKGIEEISPLGQLRKASEGIGQLWDQLTGKGDSAADKMQAAANTQMDAANKIHDTIAGGGSRARSAIPAAGTYYNNRSQMDQQINQMGSL